MKNIKKIIAMSLVILSITGMNVVQASANWNFNRGSWFYENSDGNVLTGWQQINGKWYYFSTVQTNENFLGEMITGWQLINNNWYYFYNDGSMASNTSIDGYYLNADGSMQEITTNTTNNNNNIPIQIPNNWSKINETTFAINNSSPLVYSVKETFGVSEDNILAGITESTLKSINDYKSYEKTFNGNKATCYEYLDINSKGIQKYYFVVLFKNDKVYGFMMCGNSDNYEINKADLNQVLNSTLNI